MLQIFALLHSVLGYRVRIIQLFRENEKRDMMTGDIFQLLLKVSLPVFGKLLISSDVDKGFCFLFGLEDKHNIFYNTDQLLSCVIDI